MRSAPPVTAKFEEYRDHHWRREAMRSIETVIDAERFIEHTGLPPA